MSRASLFAAAALLASLPAAADACSVSTAGIAFGAYNPRSATARDSAGTINVDCPRNADVVISVSAGRSGTFTQRRMTNGASNLNYNLFTNAARSIVLGDGSAGTGTFSIAKLRGAASRTFYGRIPGSQNVSAGAYGETLVVTVSY